MLSSASRVQANGPMISWQNMLNVGQKPARCRVGIESRELGDHPSAADVEQEPVVWAKFERGAEPTSHRLRRLDAGGALGLPHTNMSMDAGARTSARAPTRRAVGELQQLPVPEHPHHHLLLLRQLPQLKHL